MMDDGTDISSFGCLTNCVYERVDGAGGRYCLVGGDEEVVCRDGEY